MAEGRKFWRRLVAWLIHWVVAAKGVKRPPNVDVLVGDAVDLAQLRTVEIPEEEPRGR